MFRNRGNFNNHIGLPLSLIELRQRPEIAVVELGMNHAGEISTLVRVAEPDVRVWTNVGDAHLGFFSSLDAIADAKAEILESLVHAEFCVISDPHSGAHQNLGVEWSVLSNVRDFACPTRGLVYGKRSYEAQSILCFDLLRFALPWRSVLILYRP